METEPVVRTRTENRDPEEHVALVREMQRTRTNEAIRQLIKEDGRRSLRCYQDDGRRSSSHVLSRRRILARRAELLPLRDQTAGQAVGHLGAKGWLHA